jgi:hypothetical protein
MELKPFSHIATDCSQLILRKELPTCVTPNVIFEIIVDLKDIAIPLHLTFIYFSVKVKQELYGFVLNVLGIDSALIFA